MRNALRAPKSQSQIAAIFCCKCPRHQPNRSGEAFFVLEKIAKRVAIACDFLSQEISQGSLGEKALLGPKKWLRFFRLRQKIAVAIAEKSRHFVHSGNVCRNDYFRLFFVSNLCVSEGSEQILAPSLGVLSCLLSPWAPWSQMLAWSNRCKFSHFRALCNLNVSHELPNA